MNKITVGIDPDSKAHGVAVYVNGKLTILKCLPLIDAITLIRTYKNKGDAVIVHIEDVCANNSIFMKPGRMDKKREGELKARGRTLGMVQHSQVELMRMLDHYGIEYKLHKISKMWKKDKAQFEKVTGWKKQSNEDSRSGAYFGFLGLK